MTSTEFHYLISRAVSDYQLQRETQRLVITFYECVTFKNLVTIINCSSVSHVLCCKQALYPLGMMYVAEKLS